MSIYSKAQALDAVWLAPLDSTIGVLEGYGQSTYTSALSGAPTFDSKTLTGGTGSWIFTGSQYIQLKRLTDTVTIPSFTDPAVEIVFRSEKPSVGYDSYLFSRPDFSVIMQRDGNIYASIGTGSNNYVVSSGIDTSDNKWHHVVVQKVSNYIKIWIDGTLRGTSGYNSYGVQSGETSYRTIGSTAPGKNLQIDFVAEYLPDFTGKAITQAVIEDHYSDFAALLANSVNTAQAMTASALATTATIATQNNPNIQPTAMTASAEFLAAHASNFDKPTNLDTYLSTLTLGELIKFDSHALTNYGTDGQSTWQIDGNPTKIFQTGGPSGSSFLRFTEADQKYELGITFTDPNNENQPFLVNDIGDGNFSVGIWAKIPTGTNSNTKQLFQIESGSNNVLTLAIIGAHPYFSIRQNGTQHDQQETGISVNDNKWHHYALRFDSDHAYFYVDGVLKSTKNTNGSWATPQRAKFISPTDGSTLELSSLHVGSFSAVGATELTNIYNAGKTIAQAGAWIVQPALKFTNAYEDYVSSLSPLLDLKLDSTGVPQNFGSGNFPMQLVGDPDNVEFLQTGKNKSAYRFTNTSTYYTSSWDLPSGTFTTNDQQTVSMVVKIDPDLYMDGHYQLFNVGMGGYSGGCGLSIGFVSNGFYMYISDTDYAHEGQIQSGSPVTAGWHLVTAVKDGSTIKLYVDGKLKGTDTFAYPLTDAGFMDMGCGEVYWWGQPANEATDRLIDSVFVTNTALTTSQIFNLYQSLTNDTEWTATADIVAPSVATGTGKVTTAPALTASGLMVDPTQQDTIAPTIEPMTAFAASGAHNFSASKNTSNAAPALTASVELMHSGTAGSGVIIADVLIASALMADGKVQVPGVWNASPFTLFAEIMHPDLTFTKGALVKAQTLNAKAFSPTPPAYVLLTDDIWFNRLYAQHKANTTGQKSLLKFFNDTTAITVGSTVTSQDYNAGTGTAKGTNTIIAPAFTIGYNDDQNRKAIHLANAFIDYLPVNAAASVYAITDRGYTLETMIKTSKTTQVLFTGNWQSETGYQSRASQIGLVDGKLYAMESFRNINGSTPEISPKTFSQLSALGLDPELIQSKNTNVADGSWHHVTIQMGYDGRLQIWVDGKLELQKYTASYAYPTSIGYNSADTTLTTDIYISAISVNPQQFLGERDLTLNYYASIGYTPIQPDVFTASAVAGDKSKGRGNRGRALMLYFWSTRGPGTDEIAASYYAGQNGDISLQRNTSFDQHASGYFDMDTFFKLSTWEGRKEFYDWDMFPVDVQGYYTSGIVNRDSYDNPRSLTYWSGQSPVSYEIADGFKDELDNRRYLDLMNDINIEDFDMICFRNYPDQSSELDSFEREESVDTYFNIREKIIFQDFISSLREAVDSGISLMITNPRLAYDLGIIEGYEEIPDLAGTTKTTSDKLSPTLVGRSDLPDNNKAEDSDTSYRWVDLHKNNSHRVVSTLPGLTDDDTWVWTETVKYYNDGLMDFGGNDRWWDRFVHKPNGLQVGDEFLIADIREEASLYQAVPLNKIKAGKAITTFATNYYDGLTLKENPYKNYATSIALQPGDILNGTQVGGKIFVTFTELINYDPDINSNRPREWSQIELSYDAIIDEIFAEGVISQADVTRLKANPNNLNRRLEAGDITQEEFDTKTYWQLNGDDILSQIVEYGDQQTVSVESAGGVVKKGSKTRSGRGRKAVTFTSGGLPQFMVQWGWQFETALLNTPTLTTRALWWLSEREAYDVIPQRPLAAEAQAVIVQPVVTGYKVASIGAQAMVAGANIVETDYRGPDVRVLSLPMTAFAEITQKPAQYAAQPMTATALITNRSTAITAAIDEVVLYVMHTDPILYIREDIIK